jgi:NAD(P)-dependent dehydrogenase (short-subunit alcohol dehydrogenase family)
MNVIVPLSNENYYKLYLENLNITNDLIVNTYEIIRLNDYNQSNNSSFYKKIIRKIIELIKKSNNIGVFDILINILPYPIWIEWFKSCFILKYYWDDELIKKIQDSNKMKINSYLLNFAENEKNIDEKQINLFESNIINLSDSYDLNYNFTKDLVEKRIGSLKNIFSEYLENFELENYYGSENLIFLLGYNKLFKKSCFNTSNEQTNSNINQNNQIIEKIKSTKIIFNLYAKKSSGFKLKPNTIYFIEEDYICVLISNLAIKINKKLFNQYNIFGISDGIIDFETCNIKVNSNVYQKFNIEPTNIFNTFANEYNNLFDSSKSNIQLLKASEQTWFKSIIPINIQKIIKYNLSKCYECKKIWDGYSLPDYKFHCLNCGIKNYEWKQDKANLDNMTFFITGIRVKIGFATTLRLLRAGATVIGTTRYPNFALYNYSKESDYEQWKPRLIIIQADFLNLDSVYGMLDILDHFKINGFINMAFRTIRPSDYYSDSVNQIETDLKNNIGLIEDNKDDNKIIMFKPNTKTYFTDLNKVDTSKIIEYKPNSKIMINRFNDVQEIPHENSWDQTIDQVDPKEIVECVALNQLVPTLIINKIKSKLIGPNKFIIHVGSFEGQFETSKSDKHIHTNMCKSALNMLIRSLEEDSDPNLHVHTVNPGYVTGVKIKPIGQEYPLTMEDGASRITWPIFQIAKGIKLDKSWTKIGNYEKANW